MKTIPMLVLASLLLTPAAFGKKNKNFNRNDDYRHRDYNYRGVRDYYRGDRGGLPPGLERQWERRGTLPPGLERRRALPPGLQKRLYRDYYNDGRNYRRYRQDRDYYRDRDYRDRDYYRRNYLLNDRYQNNNWNNWNNMQYGGFGSLLNLFGGW